MDVISIILLLILLFVMAYDFIRSKISKSTEISLNNKKSNNKKKVLLSFSLIALAITFFYNKDILGIKLKFEPIRDLSNKTDIEILNERLIELNFENDNGAWVQKITNDNFTKYLDPLFEKYYDCLDCIESISKTYRDGGTLDDDFAKIKIKHFNRAIELGTRDLDIIAQSGRYRGKLNDIEGARESFELGIKLINSSDVEFSKSDLSYFYLQYAYIDNNINMLHKSIDYYTEIYKISEFKKVEVLNSTAGMINYYAGFAFKKKYSNYVYEDNKLRLKICRLFSRLGELGSDTAYDHINQFCN